jgi:hypothetical protein
MTVADGRVIVAEIEELTLAKPADVAEALAFALRFSGRKRVHQADDMMALIAAERLVEHLGRSGFVVMRKPPSPPHGSVASTPEE